MFNNGDTVKIIEHMEPYCLDKEAIVVMQGAPYIVHTKFNPEDITDYGPYICMCMEHQMIAI